MRLSISNQLRYGLLIIGLGGVLLTAGVLISLSFQSHLRLLRQLQQEQSLVASKEISAYVDGLHGRLGYIGRLRGLTNLPLADQYAILEGLSRQNNAYEFIALLDKNLQVTTSISSYGPAIPDVAKNSPTLVRVLSRGEDFFGPVEIDPATMQPMMTMAVAVHDRQDQPDGILLARVNLKFLEFIVSRTSVGETGYAYVVDYRRLVIAEKGRMADSPALPSVADRPVVQQIASGVAAAPDAYVGLYGAEVLGAFAPIRDVGWTVVVELPTAEAYQNLNRMLLVMLGVLALALVLAVLISIIFSRQIITPLHALTDAAAQIGSGNLNVQVTPRRADELGVLASTFNRMTSDLRQLVERLGEYNQTLEQKVAQRTAELEASNAEAQMARAEAEAASELKTKFLANMSHELRTPLNAILNFTEMLSIPRFGELTERQQELQKRVLANASHLLGLINDVLDLAKIEAGRMDLFYEPVELDSLLHGIMSTATGLTRDKGLQLALDAPGDLPAIWGDKTRVRQVLLNLLSNAAKFTSEGSITIRVRARDDGMVEMAVQDTGIGIAPEDQEVIFEEFRQVQDTNTRSYGGTGLGLPISRRLVEMHGGQMWLESTPGVGSTFTFTLPVATARTTGQHEAPALDGPPLALGAEPPGASPGAEHPLVVVVDDDPDAQAILSQHLVSAGYTVQQVLDSRQAQATIEQLQPHLVILDIQMPHLDGWAVLNQLRSTPATADVPVMICTIVDDQRMSGLLGASDFVLKPVRQEDFLARVRRWVAQPATVLLVDDDAESRQILRTILEPHGYRVCESSNGAEALAALPTVQPTLLVLDLMMPVMDGFEVLKRLHSDDSYADIPVLVVSARDLSPAEAQWVRMRSCEYLQKGVLTPEQFLQQVSHALHGATSLLLGPYDSAVATTGGGSERRSGAG